MTPITNGDSSGIGARLAGAGAAHAGKGLRYAGVSAFNVVFGQVLLIGAYSGLGWDAVPSQVFAAMVGSVPAYLLCRAWVWKVDGVISFTREVLPFWALDRSTGQLTIGQLDAILFWYATQLLECVIANLVAQTART